MHSKVCFKINISLRFYSSENNSENLPLAAVSAYAMLFEVLTVVQSAGSTRVVGALVS